MIVPISKLRRGCQPRDKENIGPLVIDLRSRGKMLDPILVYEEGGNYVIIDGHQRWQAALELGWDKVPIRIDEKPEDPVSEALARNNVRRANNNVSARTFAVMWEEIGCDDDITSKIYLEVAKKYAFSTTAVKKMMQQWASVVREGKEKQAIEEQWSRRQIGLFSRKYKKRERELATIVVELRIVKDPTANHSTSMAVGIPRDRYLHLLAGKRTFLQIVPVSR